MKWRLRHNLVLVVFIKKGRSDKYWYGQVKRGYICTPKPERIQDGALFIFDDVSALGMEYPPELIQALQDNNQPAFVVDALDLAGKISPLVPPEKVTALNGGGILSYLFLKMKGYSGELNEVITVLREYPAGRPDCKLISAPRGETNLLIDDILASGQTISTAIAPLDNKSLEVVCLMASVNIPTGKGNYRCRECSTISGVSKLYCAKFVNGPLERPTGNRKPAILSLRYLLTKALDNQDYAKGYLAKKFGGWKRAVEIQEAIRIVNREPIDLLRKNYRDFLNAYGVK